MKWAAVLHVVGALTVKLKPKEARCLWSELVEGETGTVSVFVSSGGKLKARVEIRGPYEMEADGIPKIDEPVKTIYDATISSAEKTGHFASPFTYTVKGAGAFRACVESVSRFEDVFVDVDFVTDRVKRASRLKAETKIDVLNERLVKIRTALASLRDKQARERRRLAHHTVLNDASHAAVVEGSLIETVVYVFASLFQIVFVRRWFEGKGVIFGSDNV